MSVQIAAGCVKWKGIAACPATNWLWNVTKRPTFCTKDGRDFNLFTTAADFTYKGHRATPNTTATQIAATGWSNAVLRHVWPALEWNTAIDEVQYLPGGRKYIVHIWRAVKGYSYKETELYIWDVVIYKPGGVIAVHTKQVKKERTLFMRTQEYITIQWLEVQCTTHWATQDSLTKACLLSYIYNTQ